MTAPDDQQQPHYLKRELDALLRDDPTIFEFIESASLDGMWYWDLERPEEEWMSRRFWETLGYDPDEMPHKAAAWMDIIDAEDLELAKQNVGKHLADPSHAYDQTVRYRHKHGHTVTIRCRGLAIRDADGKPLRMLGAHNDLTRERRVERLLRETNRAARIGSWEVLVKTGEVYWSDITKEIHGVPPDFQPTLDIGVRYYREGWSRDKIEEVLRRATEEGVGWDEELQIVTEQGEPRWVRAVGQVELVDGEPVRFYGAFQDIHEERLLRSRLEASEQLLRRNFDVAPNGMVIADAKGTFERVSQSFADMVGYAREDLVGAAFTAVTHPDDHEADVELIGRFVAGELDSHRMQKRFLHRRGETVWCDVSIAAGRDEEGRLVSFHVQLVDITAARLEEARRTRLAVLEDKAREMEQFAYMASHDLRQPVLTLQGYMQALEEDYGGELDADGRHYLEVMRGALTRMDTMIKGLLDYSRLSKAKQLQRVDLDALVAEVRTDLKGLIDREGARVTVDPLTPVPGYPLELRQVFQNLIANAITYRRPEIAPTVHVGCEKVEGGYRICVADNGIGIAAGDRDRIFGLFQTARQPGDRKGTGIGLASCRTIVERHGGRIWVESTPGEGSIFFFTIMTADLVAASADAPAEGEPTAAAANV